MDALVNWRRGEQVKVFIPNGAAMYVDSEKETKYCLGDTTLYVSKQYYCKIDNEKIAFSENEEGMQFMVDYAVCNFDNDDEERKFQVDVIALDKL